MIQLDAGRHLVAILAHTGEEARYGEFSDRYRTAATPQEECRYLFSLAAFRLPSSAKNTLERPINGEIRTQDAPFIVGALMTNVYSRDVVWEFVKANWDQSDGSTVPKARSPADVRRYRRSGDSRAREGRALPASLQRQAAGG